MRKVLNQDPYHIVEGPYQIARARVGHVRSTRRNLYNLITGRRWILTSMEGSAWHGNFGHMRVRQAIRTRDSMNSAYFEGIRWGWPRMRGKMLSGFDDRQQQRFN